MATKRVAYREHLAALKEALAAKSTTLVYGTSEYLLGDAVRQLREASVATGAVATAVEATGLNESSLAALSSQGSLFEPRTFYVIRRCETSRSLPKLLKGLEAPGPEGNQLCFVLAGESPVTALRTELTRLKAKLVPCFDPWPNEVSQVVLAMAADLGLKLKGDAVQALAEANGQDLVKQANELRKLALLAGGGEGKPLGAADVAPHLGMLREDDRYALDQLLLSRQWAKAQALAGNLLDRGESALALVGLLAGHCRSTLRVADALGRGVQAAALASELRLPPFVVKLYAQHRPRAAELDRYVAALQLCQDADMTMKSAGRGVEGLLVGRIIDALAVG